MSKTKKPRKKGLTKEQKAAVAAYHAEIGGKIKAQLTEAERKEIAYTMLRAASRERRAGHAEGANFAFTICLLALADKFGFGKVRINRLWETCMLYVEEINAGRLDYALVQKTLDEDYNVVVKV